MASEERCKLGGRAKVASEHRVNRIHGKRVLERAKRKFSSGASAWAKLVMARDEMTCQLCGTTEGDLHAHHIIPQSVAPQLLIPAQSMSSWPRAQLQAGCAVPAGRLGHSLRRYQ